MAEKKSPRTRKPFVGVWYLVAGLGLLVVVLLFVPEAVDEFRANRGAGVQGEFVADDVACGRNTCTSSGVWTGDDGTVLPAATARGRVPLDVSVTARAFPERSSRVYPVLYRPTFQFWVLVGVTGVAALALIVGGVVSLRPRREAPDDGVTPRADR